MKKPHTMTTENLTRDDKEQIDKAIELIQEAFKINNIGLQNSMSAMLTFIPCAVKPSPSGLGYQARKSLCIT